MSLYKNETIIGGVKCGLILRDGDGYTALFEREFASLETIENIQWDPPEITGSCILPAGCGFTVTDITYSHAEQCYRVRLSLGKQYLGDVTGYQEKIDALQAQLQTAQQQLDGLQEQLEDRDQNSAGEIADDSQEG